VKKWEQLASLPLAENRQGQHPVSRATELCKHCLQVENLPDASSPCIWSWSVLLLLFKSWQCQVVPKARILYFLLLETYLWKVFFRKGLSSLLSYPGMDISSLIFLYSHCRREWKDEAGTLYESPVEQKQVFCWWGYNWGKNGINSKAMPD